MATTSGSGATAFEQALTKFKAELNPKQQAAFQRTTLPDLLAEIENIQNAQHSTRRLQAINRLKPTLEACNQLGKVVETFVNASEFVAFVWGPIKLLLQIASSLAEAFNELLDMYERLGEELPLVQQYERLFSEDPNIKRVLGYLYKDILEFHRRALKYFQQPMWKQIFQATWKTYKSRFDDLFSDIRRHGHLIVSQATLSQIEACQGEKRLRDKQFQEIAEAESRRHLRELNGWLRAASVANDQHDYCKLRTEYPGTGRWLLDNPTFKDWFEPWCQLIPPLLWLNGIPGAGKTILASLVVEEAEKLDTSPAVLYFFCKSGDSERDNFVSMARSLLSQLLIHNKDMLLPYFHDKYISSTEAVLGTQRTIEDLLDVSIRNFQSVYIILDGIDECPRKEREIIATWFRRLVEGLTLTNSTQVRCLFVSQDDGPARKDFAGLSSIKIRSQDNKNDIQQFSCKWAAKIQKKFGVSDERREFIAKNIVEASGGMFLLAKLISSNLFHQIDMKELNYELESGRFPREINAAYTRIMARIFDHASHSEQRGSRMLLSWLTCAKRSMKWHEIQGAKSIDLDAQSVDFGMLSFRVDSKDLCGSLVEIRSDGTVELVHLTAKLFLIAEKHVDPVQGGLQLASLCVDYLNLPGFRDQPGDLPNLVLNGYYAFMDYAVSYWVRHLEASLVKLKKNDPGVLRFCESLEIFIELHYTNPVRKFLVSDRNKARLLCLEDMDSYEKLQQAVVSTRKQLTFYGELNAAEIALDLAGEPESVVERTRDVLEQLLLTAQTDNAIAESIEKYYGVNLFKCPRLSCKYFSAGFATKEQRDQHLEKHKRPFQCTVAGCPSLALGLSSEKDLKKHMKVAHDVARYEDEFPDEDEIIQTQQAQIDEVAEETAHPHDGASVDIAQEQQGKDDPKRKRQRQEHKCQHCGKIFSRRFNLASHLLSHTTERPWKCGSCDKAFARRTDFRRHRLGHAPEEATFLCRGMLRDGTAWGCGKGFARRDTLANHHRSRIGQKCIEPYLLEQRGRTEDSVSAETSRPLGS
ncbi:hypothetical protein B0I37DRAFT_381087 [Chaetomium sp. MPI-CAGE-AT-0009]|nr:hypothetical protein B0I37DRAFT_381087 [Chaetomium sp. MPI-CAGE-AT-0009]